MNKKFVNLVLGVVFSLFSCCEPIFAGPCFSSLKQKNSNPRFGYTELNAQYIVPFGHVINYVGDTTKSETIEYVVKVCPHGETPFCMGLMVWHVASGGGHMFLHMIGGDFPESLKDAYQKYQLCARRPVKDNVAFRCPCCNKKYNTRVVNGGLDEAYDHFLSHYNR